MKRKDYLAARAKFRKSVDGMLAAGNSTPDIDAELEAATGEDVADVVPESEVPAVAEVSDEDLPVISA